MNLLEQLPDSGQCAPNIEPLCARSWRPWSPVRLGTGRWRRPAVVIGISVSIAAAGGTAAAAYFHFAPVTNTSTAFLLQHSQRGWTQAARKSPLSVPQVHRRRWTTPYKRAA